MTKDLKLLVPDFKVTAQKLLDNCKQQGYEMCPSETLRHPMLQAKYWRQSRSIEIIRNKIQELKNEDAPFLAWCIENAEPCTGPQITNSIPGYSWHQWGEAMDCYWLVDGKAVWDTKLLINGRNGYRVYAEEAVKLGLDAGMLWKSFPDNPHVQMRAISNPGKRYTLQQIDRTMKERFSTPV